MARAAEPRGENMPLVRREKGEEAGGRAQGRGGKEPVSHRQGPSLALLFVQLGDHFKLRRHFAFKPWAEHKPFKVLLQFMGSIYKHRELERRRACVVAEKDTNISPLSCIPPEFNRSEALLITRLAQPSPCASPFPTAASAAWSAQPPEQTGTRSSGSSREAAMPPCLCSGKAGRLLGEAASLEALQQPCSAGAPTFAGRAFGDISRGCNLSIPVLPQHQGGFHRHKAAGRLPHLHPL